MVLNPSMINLPCFLELIVVAMLSLSLIRSEQ
jgi:hypothetical protein